VKPSSWDLFDEDDLVRVNELKAICREIGCSGMDPEMCQKRPHMCSIIRKIINGKTPDLTGGEG